MNKTSSFLNGLCAGCSALWRAIFLFRPLAALRDRVARRVRTRSLSRRIAEAFLVLTLVTGGIFSLSAYLSYDYAITHVIRWHMEPIMRLLIAAEEGRTLRKGERLSVDSELLAKELKVKWYVGEAIPDDLRPERSKVRELVRIKRDRYAMTYRDKEGQEYAIVGKIKDLDDLEEVMVDIALACVVGSLIGAGLLAYWLSRRLVSPLVELTGKVNRGEALDDTLLCSRDDEVGDLARAFAGREQALREFLNREQLFTGDVSHELRTPLTVLQGGVEILESRLGGDDKLLPIVGRMQRTVASMTAMVGTMLLLARKPEQLEFRPFDLCVLARQEEVEIRERLRGRPVTFSSLLPDRLTVLGSPELAAMVLHNLLDNACRYTEQGRILLEFRAEEMLLTDTAPVIDPDVRTRMFERGVRGTSKSPGSGLGLSLVLRGCERLGWKVAYEHWEGGNRFRVRLSQG